ncbi:MAG: sugar O-acetyltransferase [Lentisphaeria bacterium]|nr:sugar O-acetyltransferase [Lentisphaeria bacterium]
MNVNLKQRMAAGLLYTDLDSEELAEEHMQCLEKLHDFNHSRPRERQKRKTILQSLLAKCPDDFYIEPPFHCSYGYNTYIGEHFYANYNLIILDDVKVEIGEHVLIAPNVLLSASGHPCHPDLRRHGGQFSLPIRLGNHVWLGANVLVLPGVSIGDNSVIGAGSVVSRDIPPNVVAVGNPCRIMREINERDRVYYHRYLKPE